MDLPAGALRIPSQKNHRNYPIIDSSLPPFLLDPIIFPGEILISAG